MSEAQIDPTKLENQPPAEVLVGRNLRNLRTKRGFRYEH